MNKLDKEEQEILDAFDSDKLKRAQKSSQIQKQHSEYASEMFRVEGRLRDISS